MQVAQVQRPVRRTRVNTSARFSSSIIQSSHAESQHCGKVMLHAGQATAGIAPRTVSPPSLLIVRTHCHSSAGTTHLISVATRRAATQRHSSAHVRQLSYRHCKVMDHLIQSRASLIEHESASRHHHRAQKASNRTSTSQPSSFTAEPTPHSLHHQSYSLKQRKSSHRSRRRMRPGEARRVAESGGAVEQAKPCNFTSQSAHGRQVCGHEGQAGNRLSSH